MNLVLSICVQHLTKKDQKRDTIGGMYSLLVHFEVHYTRKHQVLHSGKKGVLGFPRGKKGSCWASLWLAGARSHLWLAEGFQVHLPLTAVSVSTQVRLHLSLAWIVPIHGSTETFSGKWDHGAVGTRWQVPKLPNKKTWTDCEMISYLAVERILLHIHRINSTSVKKCWDSWACPLTSGTPIVRPGLFYLLRGKSSAITPTATQTHYILNWSAGRKVDREMSYAIVRDVIGTTHTPGSQIRRKREKRKAEKGRKK